MRLNPGKDGDSRAMPVLMRIFAVFMLALGVMGCEGVLFGDERRTGDPRWDGRWVGRFESSLGVFSCPVRGTLELRLAEGVMSGAAEAKGVRHTVEGYIGAEGSIRDGFMKDGVWAVTTLTGTFGKKSAAGRWVGEVCEGNWTVWRFNRS